MPAAHTVPTRLAGKNPKSLYTTTFTNFPGTTMTFFTGFSSMNFCTFSFPRAAWFPFDLQYQGDLVSLRRLQKLLEFFIGQSRITDKISHGNCIDRIMAGDSDNSDAVSHDNMFSLTSYPKTRFLQGPYRIEVVDTNEFRQYSTPNLDFSYYLVIRQFLDNFQIFVNSIGNVF
uniref:Uncharacterized protein n=1 Tax=Candidatus Kentrum sp. TC TaxID=2126339 RepID=A0A450ZDI3_9GAMM|nr:MAG: hypothetical protein BECKTC1821D_GA0114238_11431 [Candidatus Kentron sp. TC]